MCYSFPPPKPAFHSSQLHPDFFRRQSMAPPPPPGGTKKLTNHTTVSTLAIVKLRRSIFGGSRTNHHGLSVGLAHGMNFGRWAGTQAISPISSLGPAGCN